MKELFQWVPWFNELAKKVREGRRKGLVEKVKKVAWPEKMTVAVLADGENRADPLTFFYHLASIAGGTAEKRMTIYESVADVFGIESPLDYSNGDCFFFPSPPGLNVRFNRNVEDNTQLLWEIFDRACRLDGTAYDVDLTDTFAEMLDIKGVAIPKLTQVLFLVNPRAFLPFDDRSILPLGLGKFKGVPKDKKMSWAEYLAELNRIREAFSDCQCYEINVICYLWTTKKKYHFLREGIRWYQINTSKDRWTDFDNNNWVDHGKPGDEIWNGEGITRATYQPDLPPNKPDPGDVIFVRSGKHNVRGIGIVYRNDYREPLHANGRIHVLWINKKESIVDFVTPPTPFLQVDAESHKVLTNVPAYKAILGLLPLPPPKEPEPLPSTSNHKLNQILYGPPGTGKTYSTTARAMAIVKGIKVEEVTEEHRKEFRDLRFDSNKGSGQIEMVTFHQNYSYEDFVEGIRPSLAEEGGLDYELRPGVFRKIVKAALDNSHCRFVLIIDEINRGNIPKIFGDLITLIEPSRRLGQDNETTVTLPYSGDSFGVPGNLFIIGTMNTADRSILPLDIALRRRFDHVEMMPDPGHKLISDNVDGIDLRKMLKAINTRISLLLDRERQIGHTYLFNVENVESLANVFKTKILPLLLEYFYDDWSKVQKVLGGAEFIKKSSNTEFVDHLKEDDLTGLGTYERIPGKSKKWEDINQYRSIYEKTVNADGGEPIDEGAGTP